MPSRSGRRTEKKNRTRGKNPPPPPKSRPKARGRSATRSTMEPIGDVGMKARSRKIAKHDTRAEPADRMRDRPSSGRKKLRSRNAAPVAAGRKGGPGKRRLYPKKTSKR